MALHEGGNASPTLCNLLGGGDGLSKLSVQFITEIAVDDRIRPRYAEADIGRFHRMMQEPPWEVTDGSCKYSGESMAKTPGGMNIRSSEFNALVEALMQAMNSLQLPISAQNNLLARLAVYRPDIVGR